MKIHVGTSGYSYKEWKGKFYPEKIDPGEMLRFYSTKLKTVEVNNTFYHMPTEAILSSWSQLVPDDFIFAFKVPQVITHMKQLRFVDEEASYLFRTLSTLGKKLGPVLFQLPKSFKADKARLEAFIQLIPAGIHCAFEFRNPSWITDDILDLLRNRGFCLCTADTDEKEADKIISVSDWGYLRLRRSDYGDADLSRWKELISAQDWQRAFVFFKHEEEARGPEMALRFQDVAISLHSGR